LALRCLARITHGYHGLLECVSKTWRNAIRSEQYARLKALEGWCGNWIFVSTENGSSWEAYDTEADRWSPLPVMPAITFNSCDGIVGFSCVTVCKKFLLIGGQTLSHLHQEVLSDVSVFDPFKKEWYIAAKMRSARLGFACAAILGKVYVAGGHNLACPLGFRDAEVYDPCTDRYDCWIQFVFCRLMQSSLIAS
jgi:Kelch motif